MISSTCIYCTYLLIWRCFSFRSFLRWMFGISRWALEGGVSLSLIELLVLLPLFFTVDSTFMFMFTFTRLVFVLELLSFLARSLRGVNPFSPDNRVADFFTLLGLCFLSWCPDFFLTGLGEGLESILSSLSSYLLRAGNNFLLRVFTLGL